MEGGDVLIYIYFVCLFDFLGGGSQDGLSHYNSPGCPVTHFVDQVVHELTEICLKQREIKRHH